MSEVGCPHGPESETGGYQKCPLCATERTEQARWTAHFAGQLAGLEAAAKSSVVVTTRRQLDALVAQHVMGWERRETFIACPHEDGWGRPLPGPCTHPPLRSPDDEWAGSEIPPGVRLKVSRDYPCGTFFWEPSRQIVMAWRVVERMSDLGWLVTIRDMSSDNEEWWDVIFAPHADDAESSPHEQAADTTPTAICLAALAALGHPVTYQPAPEDR